MATPESFSVNNGDGSILIQDNNLIQSPDTITTDTNTIDINTTGYQKNLLKGGDYSVITNTGNINLSSLEKDIILTAENGNIELIASNTSFLVTSGS